MSKNCCDPEVAARETAPAQEATHGAVEQPARAACPTCGQAGRPVDAVTVKALLRVPLTELRDVAYRFCRTPECPTVYYAADGEQTFDEEALRERVHQKHPADDAVFACYCFRHTPGSIRAELQQSGRTTVVERITAGINADQCACDIRNPQGACCLGNVRAVVKRVQAETAVRGAQPATVGAGAVR